MGMTNLNKKRPILITGKTGTGKTTKAKETLPNATVHCRDSIEFITQLIILRLIY